MEKRQKLAFFDLDGTLYRSSLFLSLLDRIVEEGLLEASVLEAAAPARRSWEDREGSYGDYLRVLMQQVDQGAFAGMSAARLDQLAEEVVQAEGKKVYVFTRELLAAAKEARFMTVALSHSPSMIVRAMAKVWGFDLSHGIEYEVDSATGLLTGRRDKRSKDETVLAFAQALYEHPLDALKASFAIGDSMGDVPMFETVGLPIVFNPELPLWGRARHSGWSVVVERKDLVFLLKGMGRSGDMELVRPEQCFPGALGAMMSARLKLHGFAS